ncbi:MARCKS-related protein [Macrotis lagotis]|uniref:MARCKS-related protein n=1 Tax=Macrotis lagotis TaxID=92651 RepID=UPI003D6934DA
MGSQSSKAPRGDVSADEAAPAKANGQENGHVKSNGDAPAGAGAEPAPPGPAEQAQAARAGGDAPEPSGPAAPGEAPAEGPPKETPKKKKKFSFKKPFKLSGLSFKRHRREAGGDSAGSSPTEEGAAAAEAPGPAEAAPADDTKLEEPAAEGAPERSPTPGPAGEHKE